MFELLQGVKVLPSVDSKMAEEGIFRVPVVNAWDALPSHESSPKPKLVYLPALRFHEELTVTTLDTVPSGGITNGPPVTLNVTLSPTVILVWVVCAPE